MRLAFKGMREARRSDQRGRGHHKLCYIVPSYERRDSSHMAHLPRFLVQLAGLCELHVVVQRATASPEIPGAKSVSVQRARSHVARAFELIWIATVLRRQGCRKFFVRISESATAVLGLWSWLVGAQVYCWQSGQVRHIREVSDIGGGRIIREALRDLLRRLNARLIHRFVTGPESMVDYYVREHGLRRDRIVVLYNDIDLDRVRRDRSRWSKREARISIGESCEDEIVLFVGRVSPAKGGLNIASVAETLAAVRCGARLLVVGETAESPGVLDEVQRRRLKNVRFFGAVPNSELGPYYAAADVFVLPSESEGFPRVVLEAMAYGLPLVAFDVGGVKDIVHPAQLRFVVGRGMVSEMVAAVVRLLENPVARLEQGRAGQAAVERFRTERVAEMFLREVVLGP